jgi:hypothetical protein
MNHSFNTDIAEKYGIHEAILIENIAFWLKKNVSNNSNKHDGYTWVYNSAKAFTSLFPYMSKSKIQTALKKLESKNILYVGLYNKLKYDRTKWYTIISDEINIIYNLELVSQPNDSTIDDNGAMQSEENVNAKSLNEQPIPVVITSINPTINLKGDFPKKVFPKEINILKTESEAFTDFSVQTPLKKEKDLARQNNSINSKKVQDEANKQALLETFNELKGGRPSRTVSKTSMSNLKVLLDAGYTGEDFISSITSMLNASWPKETGNQTIDHVLRVNNFERYLNMSESGISADEFNPDFG